MMTSFTDHESANCNVLNTYFTSVLTNKSLSNINEKDLSNVRISHQDIIDQLNKFNSNKSVDQIKSILE